MEPVARRHPDTVMKLARMGAAHQTRLSFMRSLLRMLRRDEWRFERRLWELDANGVGTAVYCAHGPERTYSLVAFAHDLPDDQRSDRVIATAWDATFTLFDGIPSLADLDRLRAQVPYQEAGRVSDRELSLSRANRSVRMFTHAVERLASGEQPDPALVDQVGYLMRTTAVYGSGKFGAADRSALVDRPECLPSFRLEMLSVWLTRQFTTDLVEHLAECRAPQTAVRLDDTLRRRFGVGNSTGLGMAPFLANHPGLLHTWLWSKEEALARVRSTPLRPGDTEAFTELTDRARLAMSTWVTGDEKQAAAVSTLRTELDEFRSFLDGPWATWDEVYRHAESRFGLETQELVVSLLIESRGDLVDDLADQLYIDESAYFEIDTAQTAGELLTDVERTYAWALDPDYTSADESARFWYTSEEKLEPRLGLRHEEPGAELELPLAVGRDMAELHARLAAVEPATSLAEFLSTHPECRHAARRVGCALDRPYAEIRDNIISIELRAVDLLRCKLAYFGASRFDPRSDRWTRITMFQHAPFPDEFATADEDDWAYPPISDRAIETRRDPQWSGGAALDAGVDAPSIDGVSTSHAELRALARKAARGAGLSWGEADELAEAAVWIAARDASELDRIVAALDDLDGAGRDHASLLRDIGAADASDHVLGAVLASDLADRSTTIGHVTVTSPVWDALAAFAHRTYVPETEAGRLLGAGAGLSDND